MRKHYYYVRVYCDDGKPLSTRCEQAISPRQACKQAYGVIYDNPYDTCRYLDLGTRKPAYLTQKAINTLTNNPANWKLIPQCDRMGRITERAKAEMLVDDSVFPEPHEQVEGCD